MFYLLKTASYQLPQNVNNQIVQFVSNGIIKEVDNLSAVDNIYLLPQEGYLKLADKRNEKLKPTFVNFASNGFIRRLLSPQIKSELLVKALGKNKAYKTVLDATAGMGVDAMIFAGLGLQVKAIEQSPITYLMLLDGLARAIKDERLFTFCNNIELKYGDSLQQDNGADVIYIDYMFSKEDKKSKSKKNMEMFKLLSKAPSRAEVENNLIHFMQVSHKRLVLKRPLKAELIKLDRYSHSVKGKAMRYDIYLPQK